MKKEIKIEDPVSKECTTYVLSDEPLRASDVLEHSSKAYLASLQRNQEFGDKPQLTRSVCTMVVSVKLPARYTTTIRE